MTTAPGTSFPATSSLRLGAPGVYRERPRAPFVLRPERLDVAGFVGVAPRGPVDEPVPVTSWAEYRARFGGTAGPGLLGRAVQAFFAQGGARARVLRVSPLPRAPDPAALAARSRHRLVLDRPVRVTARDEGEWGDALSVRCEFDATQRFTAPLRGSALELPGSTAPPPGSLLRVRGRGLPPSGVFRWVMGIGERDVEPGRRVQEATLASGRGIAGEARVEVEVVTAMVTVTDADPALRREERFTGLGLSPAHPRFVAAVLRDESALVTPDDGWNAPLLPDPLLTAVESERDRDGVDRYAAITAASFAGDDPPGLLPVDGLADPADPAHRDDPDAPRVHGMDRMALVPEIALLVVPDLFWSFAEPARVVEAAPRPPRPSFVRCEPSPDPVTAAGVPLARLLDVRTELTEIVRRQRRLVELADRQRRFVALLDVPPRLPVRAITRWRAGFDSSHAAAYHPWLGVVDPDDPQQRAVLVPSTAFAAGIIAERELRLGLPWGPANATAIGAVTAADPVSDADHDALHLVGVDVFRADRDGFRLTSARTLSSDPDYRQLSVRRLMTMLALVLARQTQRLVFEPHTPALRVVLRGVLTSLLRELFRAGAFAGASEEEAFFVHCDAALNPPSSEALGRLVAEVGVCPAQPLEYLVLRITQDADGTVGVEG